MQMNFHALTSKYNCWMVKKKFEPKKKKNLILYSIFVSHNNLTNRLNNNCQDFTKTYTTITTKDKIDFFFAAKLAVKIKYEKTKQNY